MHLICFGDELAESTVFYSSSYMHSAVNSLGLSEGSAVTGSFFEFRQ